MAEYLLITAGTMLIAFAVVSWLVPCRIVTGSVSGLSLVLEKLLPFSGPQIVLILNIACLLVGIRYFGKRFGIRSVYVSVLLPAGMKVIPGLMHGISLVSESSLVNIGLFLLFLTAGQSILFSLDTASGGLDTIAEVIATKTGISTGHAIALMGLAACFSAVTVYGIQTALTGIAVTAVNGQMLNAVMKAGHMLRRAVLKPAPAGMNGK